MVLLRNDPRCDSLRDDTRFQDLMRHTNVPLADQDRGPEFSLSPCTTQFGWLRGIRTL